MAQSTVEDIVSYLRRSGPQCGLIVRREKDVPPVVISVIWPTFFSTLTPWTPSNLDEGVRLGSLKKASYSLLSSGVPKSNFEMYSLPESEL